MICYPWTVNWKAQGQDIDEFKHFKRWFEEIGERPAVQARHGGRQPTCRSMSRSFRRRSRRGSASIMYNQRAIPVAAQ